MLLHSILLLFTSVPPLQPLPYPQPLLLRGFLVPASLECQPPQQLPLLGAAPSTTWTSHDPVRSYPPCTRTRPQTFPALWSWPPSPPVLPVLRFLCQTQCRIQPHGRG